MSSSSSSIATPPPPPEFTLEITAADDAAEIFVISGDFYMVDRGVGRLVTKPLCAGIYKVKAKVNQQTWEQHVTLTHNGQKVSIPPFQFTSAAPLADTAKTHEYQMAAAESESRNVRFVQGRGSCICVFAREWSEKISSSRPNAVNPMTGLSLHDANENQIVNLETHGHSDITVPDAWGSCTVAVDPGVYLLRLTLPDGARHERTIIAVPGWQTQTFLFMTDYANDHRADIARGSVLMARGIGFNHNDDVLRQIELARMALANERKILRGEVLAMLYSKFDNPMLGILGGHLLLLDSPSAGQDLLKKSVANLRSVLNYPHPDVEALALGAGMGSQYQFTAPPMLRRSWALIVNATIDEPALVPSGSLADRSAANQWAVEPWLTWEVKQARVPGPIAFDSTARDFESALQTHAFAMKPTVRRASGRPDSAFAAVRNMRSKESAPPAPFAAAAPPAPAAVTVDPSRIGTLVRALGVPRSTVESMISQLMPGSAPQPAKPSPTRTRWCFAWPAAPHAVGGKDKAALVRGSRWNPGDVITISFLDGDPALQERVKNAALIWTGPKLARLIFDFRKNTTDTLIRISFQYAGSWSVIGTTCPQITDKTQPTMNFGWLTPQSTDDEVRGVVLHEFGHALGLIHEHQSPAASAIHWNHTAVIQDLSGPPNNWPGDVIEHNMFEAYAAAETNFSELDPSSIMMYPIPPEWTMDGFTVGLNNKLSIADQEFIRSQYP